MSPVDIDLLVEELRAQAAKWPPRPDGVRGVHQLCLDAATVIAQLYDQVKFHHYEHGTS